VQKKCSSEEGHCEKDVKFKVTAQKWLWWQTDSKKFNNSNSGGFNAKSKWNMEKVMQSHLNC